MFRRLAIPILLACQFLWLCAPAHARELQPGKVEEGVLRDGKGPAYTLMLKAGDYVESEVELRNTELIS